MIPYLKLQHDWELGNEFWVHYKSDKNESDEIMKRKDETMIHIDKKDVSTKFYCPQKTLKVGKVESLDIQDDYALLGGEYGKLVIVSKLDGSLVKEFKGHVGDINDLKFLPSKQVIMSVSSDTTVKVWRIEDGLCALTLKGHNGGVLSLDIIDRGKQFITSSRDGTMRLWDCSEGKSISILAEEKASMNSCSLEKDIAVGVCDNGSITIVDWENSKTIHCMKNDKPLQSCCIRDGIISVGSSKGELIQFDIRKPESVLTLSRVSPSSVLAIQPNNWTAHQDGSVLQWSKSNIDIDLTGSNFDPIYDFHVSPEGIIHTLCRDQKLRMYSIGQ